MAAAVAGVLLAAAGFALGCASPLAQGEARYRAGDRLAALEIWRAIPSDSSDYPRAQQRIREVEAEFQRLGVRYRKRARYFERSGRLAEALLSYRLALQLEPDDRETLDHVQRLARTLASREEPLRRELAQALAAGDVARARERLEALQRLDPFDPEIETQARRLETLLRARREALLARGRRALARADLEAAQRAFEDVLTLDPQNESAQGYLAYLEALREEARRSGRPPSALPPPPAFGSDAEIRAEGFHRNALAAERAGDPWAAIRYELEALDANPKHAGARQHLAALRAQLAGEVPALVASGRRAFRDEDLETALEQWRKALLVDPDNAQVREYVKRAERLLENLERLRSEPPSPEGAERGRGANFTPNVSVRAARSLRSAARASAGRGGSGRSR